MIQYNLLQIRRAIMHRILGKSLQPPRREHVELEASDQLVLLDSNIRALICKRLTESCGRQGKAFELTICEYEAGSCFDYIKDIQGMADPQFIENSVDIAQLLVSAQDTKGSVPGGYLLVIDAYIDEQPTRPVYIVMKAERQEALSVDGNGVQALQNVFLSPAQKLYKTCVFEQISTHQPLTKDDFKAYLFDSQFNDGTQLAEYFYKAFLGLSINGNDKVQTKMFYDKFCQVIDEVYRNDVENRNTCRELLRAEMTNNVRNLTPIDAIRAIVPPAQTNVFIQRMSTKFPNPFTKDVELIQTKIDKTSYSLTESIRLYAPTSLFSNDVINISTDPDDPTVKVIKIKTNVQDDNAQ